MRNTEAREAILAKIRARRNHDRHDAEAEAIVTARLGNHSPNLIPQRSNLPRPGLARLFIDMAEHSLATVEEISQPADIPQAVASYCHKHKCGNEIVIAPPNELTNLDWAVANLVNVNRPIRNGDNIAISTAFAGIAETGSLVLASGPKNPVLQSFLPKLQIVVLEDKNLVASPEDSFQKWRNENPHLPRTINWITGPSRSGDIGMKIMLGAHGPLQLHIILLGKWSWP